jgi:hypothetical protein
MLRALTMTVLLAPVFFMIFIALVLAVFVEASRADEHGGDHGNLEPLNYFNPDNPG